MNSILQYICATHNALMDGPSVIVAQRNVCATMVLVQSTSTSKMKDSSMNAKNKEPSPRLRALSPIDAVQAWLDGDFGIGDEPAMIAAIRMDTRIVMSDDGIEDVIFNAMNERLDASTCLEQLTRSR
jgi:hypothetical protein